MSLIFKIVVAGGLILSLGGCFQCSPFGCQVNARFPFVGHGGYPQQRQAHYGHGPRYVQPQPYYHAPPPIYRQPVYAQPSYYPQPHYTQVGPMVNHGPRVTYIGR